MLPSLELNWLRKEKDIPLPLIVVADIFYGGIYYYPQDNEECIDGKFYPLDRGLIVVSESYDSSFVVNGIAHEWRHHWQWWKGIEVDCQGWILDPDAPYEEMIIQYFKSSHTEMDALLFSNKMYPCDDTLEWYEWLIKK